MIGAPVEPGYVIALEEVNRGDVGRVGAKAANLGELARAGFPVPHGFVLTTAACERFLAANALGPGSAPASVVDASVPPDLWEAISEAARKHDGARLAVRSSAVAEDLPDASFAGQYETVLDVRGEDALSAAVRQYWASALSPRVLGYGKRRQLNGAPRMAVLVQQMVPAGAPGVAFTANGDSVAPRRLAPPFLASPPPPGDILAPFE